MGLARNALLWISENRTLRQKLPRYQFIRRAVTSFMPGEELSDAIVAAKKLEQLSINAILTRLGENVSDAEEARGVAEHYVDALRQVRSSGLDAYISVKLTQLGLDLSEDLCLNNLRSIVEEADKQGNWVWVDMEQSPYVDRTLEVYRKIRSSFSKVGICLQAYLYRTERDLQGLLPLKPGVRLVKGAYAEPASVAFPRKSDVDTNYFTLAKKLMEHVPHGVTFGVATHDTSLMSRIQWEAERQGLTKKDYEFQLLYGIKSAEQRRLAEGGYRIRCLVSYGSYWFPWYVRRLAERPANMWFVLKNLF